jgi:hypothetical protein
VKSTVKTYLETAGFEQQFEKIINAGTVKLRLFDLGVVEFTVHPFTPLFISLLRSVGLQTG